MIDITTADHHGHWDVEDIKRLCEYRDRLRGTLSLAEEGLANCAQEVDRLRTALKRYGRHKLSCPAAGIFSPPEGAPYCTCGLEALTAEPQTESPI